VLWVFQRGDESLRLETRFDNKSAQFILIVHKLNANPEIERFPDAEAFRERLVALETALEADHWKQGGPIFLHDGWKIG